MTINELRLIRFIKDCPELMETLLACEHYGLKEYYIAGGSITQLIWNNLSSNPSLKNVKDFDIVYYENEKMDEIHKKELSKLVSHQYELDLVNQAYVHEWYPSKYGNQIEKFTTTEDGIKTWLTAFAIGIRNPNEIEIYAPYGIEDAFLKKVKPNKKTMSKSNYEHMTNSFKKRWNDIEILEW